MVADIGMDYFNSSQMSRVGERGFGLDKFKESNQSGGVNIFPVELGKQLK